MMGRSSATISQVLLDQLGRLAERQLWRAHSAGHYQRWPQAGPLLRHHAQIELIAEHWDDLLRIGELKRGHVSAALLIGRLQAGSRQHPLAKALLEYGKLLRTLHALRWFTDEAFRRPALVDEFLATLAPLPR